MWKEFMKLDIQHLTLADSVFLLRNWETSRGSILELCVAQKLGIPIYYLENYEPFNIAFQILKMEKIPV